MPPESDLDLYKTIPIGSLLILSEEEAQSALEAARSLPPNLKALIISEKSGAYIRGLVRAGGLPPQAAQRLALIILRIVIGELSLPQLSSLIASDFRVGQDVAQAMAKDIEKELFGPVMMELNQYLEAKQSGQQQASPSQPSTPDSPNLLDLRDKGSVSRNP